MKKLHVRILSFLLVLSLCLSLSCPTTVVVAEGVKTDAQTASSAGLVKMEMDDISVVGTGETEAVTYSIDVKEGETAISSPISLVNGTEKTITCSLVSSNGEAISEGVSFAYTSSNPEAVAVKENTDTNNIAKITAKKVTTESVNITIVATLNSEQIATATLTVNVTSPAVEGITIVDAEGDDRESKDVVIGDTYNLADDVKVTPDGATATLTYSSDNEKIAKVDENGIVTAIGLDGEKDTAMITVAAGDKSDTITIKVIDIPASIKLNKDSHSMKATDTFQLEATIVYKSGKEVAVDASKVDFSLGDDSVATVDEKGIVTGKIQTEYPKSTNVMVSYNFEYQLDGEDKKDDITTNCMITITKIPVEKITLKNTETSITMKINDTYTLEPVVAPENATDKTWEVKNSDKDAVSAKVVDGTVVLKAKAMAKAPVTITIYAKEDSSVCVTFTVNLYQTEFNVAELGVDGTDTKNDADAINDILWYATCIEEPVTVIFPAGNYYINKTLKVYTKTNIVLADDATIIRKESAGDKAMLMNRTDGETGGYGQCRDITITGGTWDGNANGENAANCLYFGHAQNITITNTKIINNSGAHLIEFAGVKNALVENVELYGYKMCKSSEFKSSGGVDADKEAIQMDVCSSSAPAMKPYDGTPCDTITIRNCNIYNYMAGVGTHTSVSGVYSTNVRIENNTFNNISNACINLRNFNNVTITGNNATNCTTFLYASGSQGEIKSNKVNAGTSYSPATTTGLRAKNAITVSNGSNFDIQQNTFQKAKSNGICVWNGSTAVIKNNKIKNNKLYGIRTQGSTITLKSNTLSKNKKGEYDTYKDAKVKSSDDIRAYYIDIKKSYKYKGTAVKPKIKISGLNKKYYKVSYKNNNKPGTATVIIKGKGKVKKTLKVKFKIKK